MINQPENKKENKKETQKIKTFSKKANQNTPLTLEEAKEIIENPKINLLSLLNSTYEIRKKHFGNKVMIHIINNGKNGQCPEDCSYCVQSKSADTDIPEYGKKEKEEFISEAQQAVKKGAFRYCMVFAGRGPRPKQIEKYVDIIKTIKSKYPLEICLSAGLLGDDEAQKLKEAGLDRLNHNLNTSENFYPKICTTHTYQDRLKTLKAAKKSGLEICSGIIAGMGESTEDIYNVALELHHLEAPSIPVNFLIPLEGTDLENVHNLTPEKCLRILCLFRYLNPKAEIRVAAGREMHLRGMQGLAFYPANSLFLEGYLNSKGIQNQETFQILQDYGFEIESDQDLGEILEKTKKFNKLISPQTPIMKDLKDLRPSLRN